MTGVRTIGGIGTAFASHRQSAVRRYRRAGGRYAYIFDCQEGIGPERASP